MNATFPIKKAGYAGDYTSSLSGEASTFQDIRYRLDKTAVVAEANVILREGHMRYLLMTGLTVIGLLVNGDAYSDEEELAWDAFFARPKVQSELARLAEEAERQFVAGETEEGGFAVE